MTYQLTWNNRTFSIPLSLINKSKTLEAQLRHCNNQDNLYLPDKDFIDEETLSFCCHFVTNTLINLPPLKTLSQWEKVCQLANYLDYQELLDFALDQCKDYTVNKEKEEEEDEKEIGFHHQRMKRSSMSRDESYLNDVNLDYLKHIYL